MTHLLIDTSLAWPGAKKALATLDREWDGLAAHRDYPMIGLDTVATPPGE